MKRKVVDTELDHFENVTVKGKTYALIILDMPKFGDGDPEAFGVRYEWGVAVVRIAPHTIPLDAWQATRVMWALEETGRIKPGWKSSVKSSVKNSND